MLDEHHPLLETYGASIVLPRQHPRATYLLLIQALEGLYGHERRVEQAERVQQHATKREQVLADMAGMTDLPRPVFKFVKKYLMKRPQAGLDECLVDVFSSLPYDVSKELAETELVQRVIRDADGDLPLPVALRIVRNDLSHGNKGYPTEELYAAVQILDRVTRAHMLRVLGCAVDAQKRAASGDRA